MLSKKEKALMKVIYQEAAKTEGKCVLSPAEILSEMSFKYKFTAEELEPTLQNLALDDYFEFFETEKKGLNLPKEGIGVFVFELKQKGLAFEREIINEKRQIKFKITLASIGAGIALSGTVIGIIIKVLAG